MTEQPDAGGAVSVARQTGREIEVAGERTPSSQTFALPTGGFRRDITATPQRARRPDGSWAPIDTNLVADPGAGALRAANTPVPMSFSAGGAGPLMSFTDGKGARVSMWWPAPLPVPSVTGSVATYRDVFPGVDLQVRAEADGPRKVLVVKDRKAADNAELAQIQLTVRSEGVKVSEGGANNLIAHDASGRMVFVTSTMRMWDDTPADRAGQPGPEWAPTETARSADVGVRLTGESLVLTPDRGLLTDPATRYPVRIDPYWHAVGQAFWLQIKSDTPNATYWNGFDSGTEQGDVRVGRTIDGSNYTARAFAFFDLNWGPPRRILDAYFQLRMSHSWSWACDETNFPFDVHAVSGLNGSTTWNNQNVWGAILRSTTKTYGNNNGNAQCPADTDISFQVRDRVAEFVANGWGRIDFGLRSRNESCPVVSGDNHCMGWRRFKDEGPATDGGIPMRLSVFYNDIPAAPANLTVDGKQCTDGGTVKLGAAVDYAVTATVADPNGENLTGRLELRQGSTTTHAQTSGAVASGSQVTWRIPASAVQTGQSYTVRVAATDGEPIQGPWTTGCTITVDRTPPSAPGVASADYPSGATQHGSVGRTGTFTLSAAGSGDVVGYRYGLVDPPTTEIAPAAAGGSVTIPVTPPRDGPVTLYAQSVDGFGNVSPITAYVFGVRPGTGPVGHWKLDETGGSTAADTPSPDNPADVDRPATVTGGPSFATGPVDAKANHPAFLRMNQVGQVATAQPVLDTTTGYTAAAWVKLVGTPTGNRTFVAQQGTRNSAFFLQYYQPAGTWRMTVTHADADSPSYTAVDSAQPAVLNTWTHLAGTYDPMTRQTRLYVNGVLAGTGNGATTWNALGALTIGSLRWNGVQADKWQGDIDDVRVYDRVLQPVEFIGFVKPVEGWYGFHDGQSGAAVDRSGNGRTATLLDGARVATGFDGNGATFNGDKAQAATAGPAVRTDNSFTVSAWVRLTRGTDLFSTAVSQDGAVRSGFELRYNPFAHAWEFALPAADTGDASTVEARATTIPRFGEWTHLTGVYNSATGQAQIWVDGVLEGTVAVASHWNAGGPLAIGRYKVYGFPAAWWEGDLDEVMAHTGALTGAEIEILADRSNRVPAAQHLAGDFTGDGRADTVVIHGYPNKVMKLWALVNSGGGDLQNPVEVWNSEFAPWEMPTGWQHDGARWLAADFTGDGKDDIGVLLRDDHFDVTWQRWWRNTEFWVFASNGAGFDEPAKMMDTDVDNNNWPMDYLQADAGDVTGDGKADLVLLRADATNEYRIFVLASLGTWFYAPEQWLHSPAGQGDPRRITMRVGDVDNDGRADVVRTYQHDGNQTRIAVAYSTGTGLGAFTQQWDSGPNAHAMTRTKQVVTDVTGDGRADIVQFYDTGSGRQMRVLRSAGRAAFVAPAVWLDTGSCSGCAEAMSTWSDLAVVGADLDGDGPDDLVVLRTTPDSKVVRIFTIRSTGTAYEQPVLRYTSGPDGL